MTIDKLPSGSYRIRHTVNKRTYSVTVKNRPTKLQAEELIHAKIHGMDSDVPYSNTVLALAQKYINKDSENKSPTTLNSYRSIINNTPAWFLDEKVTDINESKVQKVVDEYARNHSAKSTHNFYGLYKCVFADLSDFRYYSIKLPRKIKKAEYQPSSKDIAQIIEYVKGTRYDCVINLLCLGLRRGEAIAISDKDLDSDDVLTINKDLVYDGATRTYIMKDHPKTEASNRRILIPHHVAEMIREQEKAFVGNPHTINEYLHKVQDALGIPRFRLHMLRHYTAAKLHKSFPDKTVMEYMGWSNIGTMHNIYSYALDVAESQQQIVDILSVTIS